jgi:dTMP kinase
MKGENSVENTLYIVFEGIVKCGKSTQVKNLTRWLRTMYPRNCVLKTREPGGSEIAENIRRTVQGTRYRTPMNVVCEADLYSAARAQTIATVIRPFLSDPHKIARIVASDRCFIVSMSYQGYVRGYGAQQIWDLNKPAVGDLIPDIILFLDIPDITLALGRRKNDVDGDKWEAQNQAFFEKAREGFCVVSEMPMFAGRWFTINAVGTQHEVFQRILDVVKPRLPSLASVSA